MPLWLREGHNGVVVKHIPYGGVVSYEIDPSYVPSKWKNVEK